MNNTSRLCYNYLRGEGYAPQKLEEDNLLFKVEGTAYIVHADAHDQQFLRVLLPRFYLVDHSEMNKALFIANKINKAVKVGKVMIEDDNYVWAFAEQFIDSSPDIEDFFRRTILVVKTASIEFTKQMHGLNGSDRLLRNLLGL